MRYARLRSPGLLVGSGVVEAGCKTISGQRLKLGGMHWTVSGANAIIALRCYQLSGHWEELFVRLCGQPVRCLPTNLSHTRLRLLRLRDPRSTVSLSCGPHDQL